MYVFHISQLPIFLKIVLSFPPYEFNHFSFSTNVDINPTSKIVVKSYTISATITVFGKYSTLNKYFEQSIGECVWPWRRASICWCKSFPVNWIRSVLGKCLEWDPVTWGGLGGSGWFLRRISGKWKHQYVNREKYDKRQEWAILILIKVNEWWVTWGEEGVGPSGKADPRPAGILKGGKWSTWWLRVVEPWEAWSRSALGLPGLPLGPLRHFILHLITHLFV